MSAKHTIDANTEQGQIALYISAGCNFWIRYNIHGAHMSQVWTHCGMGFWRKSSFRGKATDDTKNAGQLHSLIRERLSDGCTITAVERATTAHKGPGPDVSAITGPGLYWAHCDGPDGLVTLLVKRHRTAGFDIIDDGRYDVSIDAEGYLHKWKVIEFEKAIPPPHPYSRG